MSRNAVNEIVPRKLYQRGQILTWQRQRKYQMLEEFGIKAVVNFWPKIDPDLAESKIECYLHLPAARSEQMLEPKIEKAAEWVADLCSNNPTLILCEAGVTRSVYFCVLVVGILLDMPLVEAKEYVLERVGRSSLKNFMLHRIEGGVKEKRPSLLLRRKKLRRIGKKPTSFRPS